MYNITVSEPWFSLILIGIKKHEGRLCKGKFAKLKKGNQITFSNNYFGFEKEVKAVVNEFSLHKILNLS